MIRKATVCLLLAVSLTLTTQALELPRQESSSTVASDSDLPLSPSQRVNKEILHTQQTGERRRMVTKDVEEAAIAYNDAQDALRRATASKDEALEVELLSFHELQLAEIRTTQVKQVLKEREQSLREAEQERNQNQTQCSAEELRFLTLNAQVALDGCEREQREAAAAELTSRRESARARRAEKVAQRHVERMRRRLEDAMLTLEKWERKERSAEQRQLQELRRAFSVLFSLFP